MLLLRSSPAANRLALVKHLSDLSDIPQLDALILRVGDDVATVALRIDVRHAVRMAIEIADGRAARIVNGSSIPHLKEITPKSTLIPISFNWRTHGRSTSTHPDRSIVHASIENVGRLVQETGCIHIGPLLDDAPSLERDWHAKRPTIRQPIEHVHVTIVGATDNVLVARRHIDREDAETCRHRFQVQALNVLGLIVTGRHLDCDREKEMRVSEDCAIVWLFHLLLTTLGPRRIHELLLISGKRNVQNAPVHVLWYHSIHRFVRIVRRIVHAQHVILAGGHEAATLRRHRAAIHLCVEVHLHLVAVGHVHVVDAAALRLRKGAKLLAIDAAFASRQQLQQRRRRKGRLVRMLVAACLHR